MAPKAPLRVAVRLGLANAPTRLYRLSDAVSVQPARIHFNGALPIAGMANAPLQFTLPGGPAISGIATVRFDPEAPELGSVANLDNFPADRLEALHQYYDQRING